MSAPRLLIAALLLPGLTACDDVIRNDAAAGLEQGRRLTAAERARQAAVQRGEILRETRPFYGTAVEVTRGAVSGAPLPEAVEGARGFSLALHGQADVETIAAAITSATEIPVNIRTRYIVAAEGGPGEVIEVPIGTRMAAAWDGPLSGFLDRMGARMDVAWSYDGAVITIDRMTRRSWRLALPIGATTVTDSNESEQTGLSVTSTRALDPWAELGRRLAPLAPAPAQVTFSPEAGRVDVFGPPSVISAAGKVLDDVAATAATRIGLEIAVYWVDTDRADSFGVGINASRAIGPFNAALNAAAGGETAGGLVISRGANSVSFRALARDRSVVDYQLASTVAKSGTISPINITNELNYIRSFTTIRGDENNPGSSELEIDTLETGLSIVALPRLVGPRRIQLGLTISQRALVEFDEQGNVRLPNVDNRAIRNQTVLAPGETLVLSGYEQDMADVGDQGFGVFRRIGLGGNSEAERRKVRMILLVRPTLIPSGGRG